MYDIRSFTLPELVEEGARHYAGRPVLAMVGKDPVHYDELEPLTRRAAALLELYGVKKGDRVALLSENRPEWGISYLGGSRAGAVLVPILTDFMPEQIANIIGHSESSVIFASRKFLPKIADLGKKHVIVSVEDLSLLVGPPGSFDASTKEGAAKLESAVSAWKRVEVSGDDLAAVVYTSGTTGLSKGVMLTHRNIVWDAWACRSIILLRRTDRLLSVLPLAHTYEFTVAFVIGLMQGSATYYLDKPPTATVLLPALKAVRPTIMLTVPLIMEKIYRASIKPTLEAMSLYKIPAFKPILERLAGIKLKKTFGGKIRFFGIGGAPLAADVEAFLYNAHFNYAIGYGLTETAPMLAGAAPGKQKLRSTGPILKGVEVRIANPRPDSGEGEIQVRGPNVTKGYYKDPERTKEIFTEDGWFRTGDLGLLDEAGRVYVRGRSKTMILGSSGENIYPEEIEAVINRSPWVAESLVYGDGNGLVALVQLKPEVIEEMTARVKDGLDSAEMAAARMSKAVSGAAAQASHVAGEAFASAEHSAGLMLERIKKEANEKLAAFSRIGTVKLQHEPFEKTPTQKIKRFLYPGKKP